MRKKSKDIFDRMIEFESNLDFEKFRFSQDDFLMWPIIRYRLLNEAVIRQQKFDDPYTVPKKTSIIDIIKYLKDTLLHYPFFGMEQKKFIFFGPAASSTVYVSGKWFNRLHDYFASIYEKDSIILEISYQLKYNFPRSFSNVKTQDPIFAIPIIRNKIFGHLDQKDKKNIDLFMKIIRRDFPEKIDDKFYDLLRDDLYVFSSEIKYLKKSVDRLFSKINPEIIFINCASYGNRNSCLIKWAKEKGIKTAEIQHGCLYRGHVAYNYADNIARTEYCRYLPDFFLTQGQSSNDGINTPSRKIIIGNPHFFSQIKNINPEKRKGKNILFVSDAINPDKFVEFIIKCSENIHYPDRILFKLHPAEKNTFEKRYGKLMNLKNVEIITDKDIYETMINADVIITMFTTVLFEAAGLGKKMLLYDTDLVKEFVPKDIGIRFSTSSELIHLIKNIDEIPKPKDSSRIYDKNWKSNYRKFIEKYIR